MARLVNKQFNSPIGLYSQQNLQEVLDRESQMLANGAVGIDFNNPDVGKPSNLKNSAVLRMLEEEESRQRNGYGPGSDRILSPLRAWPPPEYEQKNQLKSTFKDVVTPGVKRVAWPPPHETGQSSPYIEQNPVPVQGGPQYPSQAAGYQNNYQQPKPVLSNQPSYQQQRAPLKLDVSQSGSSPLASPLSNHSPHGYRAPTPSKGWASVQSPVHTPNQPSWRQSSPTKFQAAHQPVSQQTFLGQQYSGASQAFSSAQNQGTQQYQPALNQYQPQQQYQAPQSQYQATQSQYQTPQSQGQAPQTQYQAPPNQYQVPQSQYQASQGQFQAPQSPYQTPQSQYQNHTQYSAQPQAVAYQYPSQQQYQTQTTQQYQYSQQDQSEQSYQSQPQYQSSHGYQSVPQSPQVQSVPIQVHRQASKSLDPPPTTINLRPQAPVSQAPQVVYTSQPATATLKVKVNPKNLRGDLKWPPEDVKQKMYEEAENLNTSNSFLSIQGGKHLRGDLKWPPENVKVQAEEENRLRLELARGPVCRPRKVKKDYTEFFEQHALNSTYPGYKIPPGTQFYKPE